jgi:hypothetical protein
VIGCVGLAAALVVPAALVASGFDVDDYLAFMVVDSAVGSLAVIYLIYRVVSAPLNAHSLRGRVRARVYGDGTARGVG